MDAGDWIALGGTAVALGCHAIAMAMFMARIAAKTDSNSKAIEALISTKVSTEQGSGFQAQITRLEKSAGEVAGTIGGLRQEFEARLVAQRDVTQRLNEGWGTAVSGLSAAVARLEATVQSLSGQIQQLSEAERARSAQPPAQHLDLISILTLAAQAAPLVRQVLARAQ